MTTNTSPNRLAIRALFTSGLMAFLVTHKALAVAPQQTSEQIQTAVFRNLMLETINGEDDIYFHFRFVFQTKMGRLPLRKVKKLEPKKDGPKLYRESHSEGVISRPFNLRRTKDFEALALKLGHKPSSKPEGKIVFYVGQILWDGKDRAMVQAGRFYYFYDKSQGDSGGGSANGWMFSLKLSNGVWGIESRMPNLAAG